MNVNPVSGWGLAEYALGSLLILAFVAVLVAFTVARRIRVESNSNDTARNELVEGQQRLVEELQQSDKIKTEFLSTISHELRTPLTSIVGYLEMMQDGYGGDLSPQHVSMLDVMDRNSRRLLSLIEDLLVLSRIESGTFKLARASVDIEFIVAGAVQALSPLVAAKKLCLDVDIAPDAGDVTGDAGQLERVVLNLVSNAIKFTKPGGRIKVTAARRSDRVVITVTDDGIGIPKDEQQKLFTRFFRSSSAGENAIQGTGLGLTIVKSIVEGHGGTVSLESDEDKGTSVTVSLPGESTAALVRSL